jgi:transcriptional repressor NrdR
VYHSFQDLNAFSEELERLQTEPTPEIKRRQLKLIPDSGEKS